MCCATTHIRRCTAIPSSNNDDDNENATNTNNATQQLFPIANSSSTGSIHPVTGIDGSLTHQSTISITTKKKEKKTHGVQIGCNQKRNGSNLSSKKKRKIREEMTDGAGANVHLYTDILNGQIRSSTEHHKKD